MPSTAFPVDLWSDDRRQVPAPSDPSLAAELSQMALRPAGDVAFLSGELFDLLRKHTGSRLAEEILLGIQHLAAANDPAGARLLAAFVDVATPADRLLPLVGGLSSARRLWVSRLAHDPDPGLVMNTWKRDFERVAAACLEAGADLCDPDRPDVPGLESPWGQMRAVLDDRIGRVAAGHPLAEDLRGLLVALLRLEVDAWQERISSLAGNIHPFKVDAIQRVLPILSRADADIRDLRHLIGLIEGGHDREAFCRPQLRAAQSLEDRELQILSQTLADCPELAPLDFLWQRQQDDPIPGIALSFGVARLQALAARLQRAGLRRSDLDLLSASLLVFSGHSAGEFALEVPEAVREPLAGILAGDPTPVPGKGPSCWSLVGTELLVGQLVVVLPEADAETGRWPHHLPTVDQPDPRFQVPAARAAAVEGTADADQDDQPEEKDQDVSASAMKNLVLTNIQSASLVLGFLRDPKFVAIPGLVESVVQRTRNPQVIETVAHDRTLHTGFANRTVPLACLRSPVNVSVKTLRRFIHVKYVSKIDLKRMAQDRTGIRKEVAREIQKYLETLA